jgi:hypothetical protein
MLKLPRTSTVSFAVFASPSTVHLPPFRWANLGANVHIVPSAVIFAIPLRFGAARVPVPIPVMDSPFFVICKYLIVRVALLSANIVASIVSQLTPRLVLSSDLSLFVEFKSGCFIININNPHRLDFGFYDDIIFGGGCSFL